MAQASRSIRPFVRAESDPDLLSIHKLDHAPFVGQRVHEEEASAAFVRYRVVIGAESFELRLDQLDCLMIVIADSYFEHTVCDRNDEASAAPRVNQGVGHELAGQLCRHVPKTPKFPPIEEIRDEAASPWYGREVFVELGVHHATHGPPSV